MGCQCNEIYSLTSLVKNFFVLLHLTLNSLTCSPLSTWMLWTTPLGGGLAILAGGLAITGAGRSFGTHLPSGMSVVKWLWHQVPFHRYFREVLPKYEGYKWQCLTTHCPARRHTYPQRNAEVDKVTPPPLSGKDTF